MIITEKEFTSVIEMTNYLKTIFFKKNEIFICCFMSTDETYWKEILIDHGYKDENNLKLMEGYLGSKKYSYFEFAEFMDFVNHNPKFEYFGKKEFYEIEIYTKKIVYFVNSALKRILIGKKNIFNNIMIGNISSKYWNYEFINGTWEAKTVSR